MATNNSINNQVVVGDFNVLSGNLNVGTATPANPYDIALEKSVAGLMGASIQNISANAAASTVVQHIVEPAAGDAYSNYVINGGQNWSAGLDNSDSDAFKITTGNSPSAGTEVLAATTAGSVTVGTTTGAAATALWYGTGDFTLASATGTVMSALDTGEINYPLQPAFLAYLATTVTNVTGSGAQYILGTGTALTEVFDQNSDFNTNGTFTAPVTGRYQLQFTVRVTGCTVATTFDYVLVTSNRNWGFAIFRAASALDQVGTGVALADMDAGDTAQVRIQVSGEAGDTDDILGSASVFTSFSGYLAC